MNTPSRDALRRKRHERLRLRLSGSTERPRLSVFRSAKYIYAQVVDDTTGNTLAAASSREAALGGGPGKTAAAHAVGRAILRISGSTERPRLSVFRSAKYIYAQVVDDTTGNTLAASSSREAALGGGPGKIAAAHAVGRAIAERARAAGVSAVVLDRGGYRYHGRVRSLAEGAREGGLDL